MVSGYSAGNDFIFKTDASGNFILGRQFNNGGSAYVGRDIAQSSDSGYAIVTRGKLIKFRENMSVCNGSSLILTPSNLTATLTCFSWAINNYTNEIFEESFEIVRHCGEDVSPTGLAHVFYAGEQSTC